MPYRLQTLTHSETQIVWHGAEKAAILFPPGTEGEPYMLYPHPGTYPSLTFAGLPEPLRPEFMPFDSLQDLRAFLSITPNA